MIRHCCCLAVLSEKFIPDDERALMDKLVKFETVDCTLLDHLETYLNQLFAVTMSDMVRQNEQVDVSVVKTALRPEVQQQQEQETKAEETAPPVSIH